MSIRLLIVMLLSGDALLSAASASVVLYLYAGRPADAESLLASNAARVSFFMLVLLFSSFFVGLYNQEGNTTRKEVFIRVFISLALSVFILSSFYYLIPFLRFDRGVLAASLALSGLLLFLWHTGHKAFLSLTGFVRRVIILGTGPLAKQIGGVLATTNHHYVLAGYVNCPREPLFVPPHTVVGDGKGLIETAKKEKAHKIVISLSERRGVFPLRDVLACKLSGIDVVDAPSFYEQITGKLLIENITPSWFIFSDGFRLTAFKRTYKRAFDIPLSLLGLTLALPVIPLAALIIKMESPSSPVLFRQLRVGQGERNFVLYKFRTMRRDAESRTGAVWARKDDPRVTAVGRFMRKYRLDELPQLYNVLRGDMSFVGPRPERPEFVEKLKRVIPYYSERHTVKPGITGWAQIKYPYGASVEDAIEKLRYDLFYIKNISLFLDLLIILETVKVVLLKRGGR
ncbi:MAG: TIGR03013 family PEP-CTERM/XrtA system glycosyltransferase [Nitrospirales bacterium]|nr:TIGR03013 family PEP-CTERM/XrtA system glycosyltransferase [Nitrospirales bacterium]